MNGAVSTVIGKLGVAAAGVTPRESDRNANALFRKEIEKWPERHLEALCYCDVKTCSSSGARPHHHVYGRQPNTRLGRISGKSVINLTKDFSGWQLGSDASPLGVQQEMPQMQRARAAITKRDAKNKKQYDRRQGVKTNFASGEVALKKGRQISRRLAANKLALKRDGLPRIAKAIGSTAHSASVRGSGEIIKGPRREMLKRADVENAVGRKQ